MSEGNRWAFSGYGQMDYTFFGKLKLILGAQVNKTKGIKKHIAPRVGGILRPVEQLLGGL